jgi:DNA-binding transcriptional MocR family regulator
MDDRSRSIAATRAHEALAEAAGASPLSGRDEHTLSAQTAARVAQRIETHALKPGTRLSSIRAFAAEQGVSRSTVVDAYDRLIAAGYIESRRGSGFYVCARRERVAARVMDETRLAAGSAAPHATLDVVWLLRSQLRQAPAVDHPGAGLLPGDWLDAELVASSVRAVGRARGPWLLKYGEPEGYLPLREQLARRLGQLDIGATTAQIVTTAGVTQAIDLVARRFVAPGDTVFVEDPGWFVMFGRFAAFGARLVGVPRGPDGPDLAALASLLQQHSPKLFVLQSVLHNPTGTSMSAANAHQLLKLAERHDFTLVEDDVYGDLHGGRAGPPAARLAALDQLRRVVYVGGFSKTLAANLRVGFIAAHPDLAHNLTDLKALTGLSSPELNERVVARVLASGQYRRLIERIRAKVDLARARTARALEKMGARVLGPPDGGMYLWVDFGRDTNAIAAEASRQGILCAPGSLFSPTQLPSHWMRVSVATCLNPVAMRFLAESLQR